MTGIEAARLVNRTERTIARWKLDGCKLDENSLLLWAEKQRHRARGRSKTQTLHDLDRANDVRDGKQKLAALLRNAPEGEFADLPCPASYELQVAVCDALDELVAAFKQRAEQLKSLGHADSIEMAVDDYNGILRHAGNIKCLLGSFEK